MTHILECLGEETPIDSFRHSDGEWLKTWLRDKGYKAETVNKHIKDLKRMFALQVAERTIDFHPFSEIKGLKIPPEEKIDYFIPNEEQIQIIFKKAEENDRKNRPLFKGRLTLFLLLLFGCGLRLSEAMETKIENIDWETRGLLVIKTKSKKPRMVGLGKKLYQQLLPLRGQEGFILPRLSLDWVSRGITKHLHRCGFNKMRPHDIRHTYVTLLQEKNVSPIDAMGRTGHSDMQMLSHYSHPKLGIIFEDQFEFMQE
jgi:integrase